MHIDSVSLENLSNTVALSERTLSEVSFHTGPFQLSGQLGEWEKWPPLDREKVQH